MTTKYPYRMDGLYSDYNKESRLTYVYNLNGDLLFSLRGLWEYSSIEEILDTLNHVYASGYADGTRAKQAEIRRALGLEK